MGAASSSTRGGSTGVHSSSSSSRSRITKTSLALLWLLSSSEIFGCCRRIESTAAGVHQQGIPHHHHHHHHREGECHGAIARGGAADEGNALSRSWKGLAQGMWKRPANSCTAADNARHVLHRRGGHAGHAHGAAGGDMTTFGLPLPVFKIILQLLLTGLNVVCWFVPMKIKRFRENQQLISLANAFSGGVFLSLAFGHMIPHAMDGFDDAGYAHNVPFFVTLAGYLVIFFVEKIAFDTHSFIEEHHHHHHHDNDKAPAPAAPPAKLGNGNGSGVAVNNSGRSAIVLLFALAVHAVFETMALGLSDTPLQAGLLAASIALHQPAESIALLVAFLKSGLSEAQTTRYLTIFSAIGTCGVFLGLAVSQLAAPLWESIFVALAAGTFVYVGCTEIVAEEFEEREDRWKKFGALLAGVLGVGWLCVLTEGWEHH